MSTEELLNGVWGAEFAGQPQVVYVLDTRLRSLRRLEEMALRKEQEDLTKEKASIETLLGSERKQWQMIAVEVRDAKKKFGPETKQILRLVLQIRIDGCNQPAARRQRRSAPRRRNPAIVGVEAPTHALGIGRRPQRRQFIAEFVEQAGEAADRSMVGRMQLVAVPLRFHDQIDRTILQMQPLAVS